METSADLIWARGDFDVSSHTVVQIELLIRNIHQPLVANQIWLGRARYSPIAERSGFVGIVDYCRLHDIQVQAFPPLKVEGGSNKPILLNPEPPADSGRFILLGMMQLRRMKCFLQLAVVKTIGI